MDFIEKCIKGDCIKDILLFDQMNLEKIQGRLQINNFEEGDIVFPPTYKFQTGCSEYIYGGGEKMPGWTDRILYILL